MVRFQAYIVSHSMFWTEWTEFGESEDEPSREELEEGKLE